MGIRLVTAILFGDPPRSVSDALRYVRFAARMMRWAVNYPFYTYRWRGL